MDIQIGFEGSKDVEGGTYKNYMINSLHNDALVTNRLMTSIFLFKIIYSSVNIIYP